MPGLQFARRAAARSQFSGSEYSFSDRRLGRSDRAMLAAWFGLFLLFYCFWGPYEAWWFTRYLEGKADAVAPDRR